MGVSINTVLIVGVGFLGINAFGILALVFNIGTFKGKLETMIQGIEKIIIDHEERLREIEKNKL